MSVKEYEWNEFPVVKITEKDKSLARMVLSGTPQGEEYKMVRGLLYYSIINNDFIHTTQFEKFIELAKAYLNEKWPSIADWDAEIAGATKEDIEWNPHLEAYLLIRKAEKKLPKAN